MALKNYGALRASVVDYRLGTGANAHFQVHCVSDDGTHYRIAVNVQSQESPSELEYIVDSNFRHVVLDAVAALAPGWNALPSAAGGAALDFIRSNLFDQAAIQKLPFAVPGPDNDLNERIEHFVKRAAGDDGATLYAFGERWGPEPGKPDKIFGFEPGGGVHDIHMNQANVGRFEKDNGVYQDGALLVHFPARDQWVAAFLKFQSQTWHTDDQSGNAIGDGETDGIVRIVAALANAVASPETETVTLLNTTPAAIDLGGWKLADRAKSTLALSGSIDAGETLRVTLPPQVVLPNGGGAITLLNPAGLRVDGVAYTGAQAAAASRTIVF